MCMNLYRHVDRELVQFDFVKHTSEKGDFEDEIISLGGRIFEAPRYKVSNHLQYVLWWKRFYLKHPEYRIIHGHYYTISAIYLRIAKHNSRITIGHSHNTAVVGGLFSKTIKTLLIRQIGRLSDYCFACSREAGEWMFKKKSFKVLKNAIKNSDFTYSPSIRAMKRKELNLGDSLTVCTVGRMFNQKNPFGIIEIISEVLKLNPTAKLLWVGDGVLRPEIEAKLKEKGIESSVILTGVRSDVNELLQAADVFVLPSFYEGLPVSVIEAQAAGLRCFLSDRITTEVDITGRCSFLPLESPDLWAEAICSSDLTKDDTREQIIEAGYDIQTTAAWLQNFYLSISEDKVQNKA